MPNASKHHKCYNHFMQLRIKKLCYQKRIQKHGLFNHTQYNEQALCCHRVTVQNGRIRCYLNLTHGSHYDIRQPLFKLFNLIFLSKASRDSFEPEYDIRKCAISRLRQFHFRLTKLYLLHKQPEMYVKRTISRVLVK